ncbi:MAG: type II toxin-antitoxin system RelE/ParE family toxin [Candidatus Korobacteraceae bacterium]
MPHLRNSHNSPGMGAPKKVKKFPNIRMWRVREFEKYLIFYEPKGGGIEIVRVIHAAQDHNRIVNVT